MLQSRQYELFAPYKEMYVHRSQIISQVSSLTMWDEKLNLGSMISLLLFTAILLILMWLFSDWLDVFQKKKTAVS